jgi:hypothetical protein
VKRRRLGAWSNLGETLGPNIGMAIFMETPRFFIAGIVPLLFPYRKAMI